MLGSTKYLSTATTVVGAYWITVRRNVSRRGRKIHRTTKTPRNSIEKLLVTSESNSKVKRLRIDEYMRGELGLTWSRRIVRSPKILRAARMLLLGPHGDRARTGSHPIPAGPILPTNHQFEVFHHSRPTDHRKTTGFGHDPHTNRPDRSSRATPIATNPARHQKSSQGCGVARNVSTGQIDCL